MNCTLWIQVVLCVVAVIAAVFAWLGYWNIHRHRVIYEIKKHRLTMPTRTISEGEQYAIARAELIEAINKDLKSGKYTILDIVQLEDDFHVFLGKIKKKQRESKSRN
jgi:hypothetical protein